jgi:hypothetical protein
MRRFLLFIARVFKTVSDKLTYWAGAEPPHPYLCFAHGGSASTEKQNLINGFQCPRCAQAENPQERDKKRLKYLLSLDKATIDEQKEIEALIERFPGDIVFLDALEPEKEHL